MNITEYRNVLEDGLVETLDTKKIRPSDMVFQQDNAPCHVSKDSRSWFSTNNIPLLNSPANSPDLNPIENAWAYLEKRLRKRFPTFSPRMKYGKFCKMRGIKYHKQ